MPVLDDRLDKSPKYSVLSTQEKIPIVNATVKFVDIAGLVKGASEEKGWE